MEQRRDAEELRDAEQRHHVERVPEAAKVLDEGLEAKQVPRRTERHQRAEQRRQDPVRSGEREACQVGLQDARPRS